MISVEDCITLEELSLNDYIQRSEDRTHEISEGTCG